VISGPELQRQKAAGGFAGGWGWPTLQFWHAVAAPINAIYPVIMHMLTTQSNENKYLAPRAVLSRAALLHVVSDGDDDGGGDALPARSSADRMLR
jgi:hypothetical protein